MATDLIEVDQENPAPEVLARAGAAIRSGAVIAIPTDALYTLVADPFNLHAVGRVFHIDPDVQNSGKSPDLLLVLSLFEGIPP